MKLKKIASLMLAGVMAVSMLAACGDNATSNGGASSEAPVVTVNSASKTLYDALDIDYRKAIDNVAANTKADSALKSAVELYISDKNAEDAAAGATALASATSTALTEFLDAIDAEELNTTAVSALDGNDKTGTYAVIYEVGGGMSDTAALEAVADDLMSNVITASTELVAKDSSAEYEYDYTLSASIVTREFNSQTAVNSVKYVAVVLTQTVTEV